MNKPEVSIIIPLYNHERYISSTIESALKQTHSNFELIIINDGSTDTSEDIVKTFSDERIKYFHQQNKGAHAAINRGLDIAQGSYISILNSDDVYHEKRLELCLDEFKINPDLAAVFTNVNIIKNNELIHIKDGSKDNWKNHESSNSYKGDNDFLLDQLGGCFLVTTSNLFCRKSLFDEVGYFRNYRYAHDYDMFLKIGLKYRNKVQQIKKPLLTYRFHESNTIHDDSVRPIFETNIVLASFLNSTTFENIINKNEVSSIDINKFFNSIQTIDANRILLALLATTRNWSEEDFEAAANDTESSLYKSMTSYKSFKSTL